MESCLATLMLEPELMLGPEENPAQHPLPMLTGNGDLWLGHFAAMASECEVLIEGVDEAQALALLMIAAKEAWRIEHKFSRYVAGNIINRINTSAGQVIEVDPETALLLNFADQCYQLSDGLFDISSGVLRKIWRFDGSDTVPESVQINDMLNHIGWHKVNWQAPNLSFPKDMELDFGGIGKEYAVDRVMLLINAEVARVSTSGTLSNCRFVVNFGGDLACSGPRLDGSPWTIGVEGSDRDKSAVATVSLSQGAVATSGDSRRYLLKEGIRYSHILNPLTGKSVIDAPHAISVAAASCMQAGMLSTFAMLQGEHAEAFLEAQEVQYWLQRD
ncbi:MAG: thiamine biosynthesis lipoprotein [Oleiphilaceae bacterium]|jgi:thiamine biosynthesis lipoprotein